MIAGMVNLRRLPALLLCCALAPPLAAQEVAPGLPPEPPVLPDVDIGEAAPEDQESGLDALYRRLAEAEDESEGASLTSRIARLWSDSGSDSFDLLLRRGREAMEAEEYDKAVSHLTALTTLAPDFAEGWSARATAYYLDDEYWAAVADIQRTLALDPRHFGALTGLGVILERIGDEAGALAAQREALSVNPHLESARDAIDRLAPKVDGRKI